MDASGQNYKDIFRYTDVEYTPEGHTDVYRWDDFLGIAGGHVLSAKSIKALIGNCPAWIECFPSYSEKAAKGVDDAVQAVKAYRLEGKRVHREVIPGYLYETAKAAAAKTAGGADGGTGPHI